MKISSYFTSPYYYAEEMRKSLDKGGYVPEIYVGFSDPFDAINHDLLRTKLKEN